MDKHGKSANATIEKKKAKEREKRIKQNKLEKQENFDPETEEVIEMTNKNRIKKDAKEKKKIEQKKIKRKSKYKKIKLILKILLLLAIIVGGIVFAMISPIFNINQIEVLNNNQVSSDEVISLSELKTGENIFRFLSYKTINKIKTNAYIENVKIHRKIPNKIQIEVEEREHDYSVDFLGKYAYINKQGYILEISPDSKQKTIIQGISSSEDEVEVGKRLCEDDLEKLDDVIKIMDIAKEYNLDTKITSIEISDKNNYNIYLETERKRAYLGDSTNLSNKLLYVNAIIEQEKDKSGKIYANGDLNNGFKVYFQFDV